MSERGTLLSETIGAARIQAESSQSGPADGHEPYEGYKPLSEMNPEERAVFEAELDRLEEESGAFGMGPGVDYESSRDI